MKNNENVKRAVFYARVSTFGQVNGTSLEGQRSEVHEWAQKNGYEIVAEYADETRSGRNTSRQNFKRMVAEAPGLKVEAVLCWKHSRLFRNMEEAVIHRHLLAKKNIKFISIKEQIEDGPVGRLVEHIIDSEGYGAWAGLFCERVFRAKPGGVTFLCTLTTEYWSFFYR